LIDQIDSTNVIQKKLSKDELISSIEELLLKADENMNSKGLRKPQMIEVDDDEDYNSDQSDDEEPILDIAKNDAIKLFELQQHEFRTVVVSLNEKFYALEKEGNDQHLQDTYEQLQRELKYWENYLPIYSRRTDIVELVRRNQILILKADTGAGKSTQVVQYLCDAGFAKESTRIVYVIHNKFILDFRTNPLYSTTKTRSLYLSGSCSTRVRLPTRTGSRRSA
jgi:HrpA-like RNA helicase